MRARRIFAVVLVVFAAVLAPLTITAYWIHDRIMSTDGYVETVAPLADNQDITDAIAERVVNTLFERADVQKRITDVLPGPVDALGRTFSNSLRNLATNQAENFLESDAVPEHLGTSQPPRPRAGRCDVHREGRRGLRQ